MLIIGCVLTMRQSDKYCYPMQTFWIVNTLLFKKILVALNNSLILVLILLSVNSCLLHMQAADAGMTLKEGFTLSRLTNWTFDKHNLELLV